MGIEPEQYTEQYRYPGTKFFEPHQRRIFFGREQETHDLTYSLKAYDVFVIFADSGIGKTSMLNAGLIPELEKENMEPIKFRFQDTSITPLQIIYDQLQKFDNQSTSVGSAYEGGLWRLYKACDFNSKMPLFIFDQFEEFFNHSKVYREEFIHELAELINQYLPDPIREEMRVKFREMDPTPLELKYYSPAKVKLLFLIRADKLKLLDDFSKKIPLILRNRFHLKPLTVKQAEQAILLPALLPSNQFVSPSFNFEEEAVAEICNYLKNDEGEVESFQLQILCQELEKRILSRYQKKEKALWITKEELGGEAGMDSITKNYYTNQLQSMHDPEMRKKAIELIEDRLIVENRRISLPDILLEKEGYSKDLLDYLLNTTRLIRVYNDRNSRYFEISHDRLLPSILKLKQQRQEEEDRLAAAAERERLLQEQAKKDLELLKQRRINQRFRLYSFVLVLMLIGLLFAFRHIIRLETETRITTANSFVKMQNFREADSVLKVTNVFSVFNFFYLDSIKQLQDSTEFQLNKKQQFFSSIKKGDTLTESGLSLKPVFDSLFNIADSLAGINALSKLSIESGDKLLASLNGPTLLEARKYYNTAKASKFAPLEWNNSAEWKLGQNNISLDDSFGQCITAITIFLHAQMQDKAHQAVKEALDIKASAALDDVDLSPDALNALDSLQKVLRP